MAKPEGEDLPTMHGPAAYRICVRGHLDARWTRRLGGLRAHERRTPQGDLKTVLIGRLADQAALAGVFNTLYELHLPVLSVEYLGDDPGRPDDG